MVTDNAGISTHRVNFPDNLAFGDSTHCGVAGHLTNDSHIHGDEQGRGSEVCGGGSGFIARVPCPNYDDVVCVVNHVWRS